MKSHFLSRDRDRVLIPETVSTTLEKYHIQLGDEYTKMLMEKFMDHQEFEGMTNYEDLVRYLEEMRLEGSKKPIISRKDNFILYETEQTKANYRRNKSWTTKMEERLVADLTKEVNIEHISLSDLEDKLHIKDSYGHNTVSAPQLRSVLRNMGIVLSGKVVAGVMKASDVDSKSSYSIPVIMDIFSKIE